MFTFFLVVFLFVSAAFAAPGTDYYRDIRLEGVNVTSSTIASTLNPVNGEIYLYYNNTNTLVRITENSRTDTLSVLDFERFQDRERKLMDTDPAGQFLYFWDTGVGRVYTYDLSSGELSRIDNSFHHKNQYNHAAFVDEQSRINAMGGYGLWTSKNYMTRFTMDDLEWNMPGTLQSYKPILASRFGHLFKYNGLFYYIVEDYTDARTSPVVYHCNYPHNRWKKENTLTSLKKQVSLRPSNRTPWFKHTGTYRLDRNNGIFGFLSTQNESQTINLLDLNNQLLHRINTDDFNLQNVRAIFYSDRINRWILLGHPQSLGQREELRIRTFEFDSNHPWISTVTPSFWHSNPTLFGIVILGGLGLVVLFGMRILFNKDPEVDSGSESVPVVLFRKEKNKLLEVFFNGNKLSYVGDQSLEGFLKIIYEMAANRTSKMPISDLDEKLFSNSSHSSYKSRTRKKLIEIVNRTAGSDIIEERKSQTDKRVKILHLHLEKIKIDDSEE